MFDTSFQKLSAVSLTDLFVQQLERMILSGELRAGERLPPERALAERMNVSTAVVNGGVQKLAARGLLKVVPRKGIFVADYMREGNLATLEAVVSCRSRVFDNDIFRAFFAFRNTFEMQLTSDACRNRTGEDLYGIEQAIKALQQEQDRTKYSSIAFEIHRKIAAASGNVVYSLILASFAPIYICCYEAVFWLMGKEEVADFFRDILECMEDRDDEGAEAITERSVDWWRENLEKNGFA